MDNINKAIDVLSSFSFNKSVISEKIKDKMIQLMLVDLSSGAYYEDDAAQICEVKHSACNGNENTECAKCLYDYYYYKAEVAINNGAI